MSYTNNNENLRPSPNSLANIKVHLNTIIRNIEQLEAIKASIHHSSDEHSINSLMLHTDRLLSQVENSPLERLAKKREKKKSIKRLKKKAEKSNSGTSEKKPSDWLTELVATHSLANANDSIETVGQYSAAPLTASIKQHHRLYLRHQGERFRHVFELLEKLHNARRGQDQDASSGFSSKLLKIRQKWHEALQEIETEQSKQQEIEEQWDEVLFGRPENFFYHKPNDGPMKSKDFLRVRRIWDSYLTGSDGEGTSIPIGFVVPRIDCDAKWMPYRTGEHQ